LDHLIRIGILEEDWEVWSRGFYMTADSILCLHREGHIIGSHSVSHRVMSKLSAEVQSQEIRESVMTLATITGAKPITFCYPYGGFHSFTDETEELLREAGIRFSFNVEQRDIQPFDLINRPHALPRYDCNQFPFGEVTVGR
jgi:peptidoglycan/xylan/chitin deacetylase (PgdA/CDA1 family)